MGVIETFPGGQVIDTVLPSGQIIETVGAPVISAPVTYGSTYGAGFSSYSTGAYGARIAAPTYSTGAYTTGARVAAPVSYAAPRAVAAPVTTAAARPISYGTSYGASYGAPVVSSGL